MLKLGKREPANRKLGTGNWSTERPSDAESYLGMLPSLDESEGCKLFSVDQWFFSRLNPGRCNHKCVEKIRKT